MKKITTALLIILFPLMMAFVLMASKQLDKQNTFSVEVHTEKGDTTYQVLEVETLQDGCVVLDKKDTICGNFICITQNLEL